MGIPREHAKPNSRLLADLGISETLELSAEGKANLARAIVEGYQPEMLPKLQLLADALAEFRQVQHD